MENATWCFPVGSKYWIFMQFDCISFVGNGLIKNLELWKMSNYWVLNRIGASYQESCVCTGKRVLKNKTEQGKTRKFWCVLLRNLRAVVIKLRI